MLVIKLCPFCGGDADIEERIINHRGKWGSGEWYVQCLECGCRTDSMGKSEAIDYWNSRAKE